MSDFSLDFAAISPDDVKAKIDAILKVVDLARIANINQVHVVLDFIHAVADKPVTAKIIAVLIEAYQTGWTKELNVLKEGFKS